MSASFTKGERLSSFKEIQDLMKKGETFFHYPFKVVYRNVAIEDANEEALNAIIVSVPKRNFKRAVKRNLLKRRIRESYRLNKGLLVAPQGEKTNALFVYVAKEVTQFSYIEKRLKEVLVKISEGETKGGKKNQEQGNETAQPQAES